VRTLTGSRGGSIRKEAFAFNYFGSPQLLQRDDNRNVSLMLLKFAKVINSSSSWLQPPLPANLVASMRRHSLCSFQDFPTSQKSVSVGGYSQPSTTELLTKNKSSIIIQFVSSLNRLFFLFFFLLNTTLETSIQYSQVFYLLSLRSEAPISLKALGENSMKLLFRKVYRKIGKKIPLYRVQINCISYKTETNYTSDN